MAAHACGSRGARTSARARHQAACATTRPNGPPTRVDDKRAAIMSAATCVIAARRLTAATAKGADGSERVFSLVMGLDNGQSRPFLVSRRPIRSVQYWG